MGESELRVTSRTAFVLFSSSDNNTRKGADEIASVLGAQILSPEAATPELLSEYTIVGFGSGIFDQ